MYYIYYIYYWICWDSDIAAASGCPARGRAGQAGSGRPRPGPDPYKNQGFEAGGWRPSEALVAGSRIRPSRISFIIYYIYYIYYWFRVHFRVGPRADTLNIANPNDSFIIFIIGLVYAIRSYRRRETRTVTYFLGVYGYFLILGVVVLLLILNLVVTKI